MLHAGDLRVLRDGVIVRILDLSSKRCLRFAAINPELVVFQEADTCVELRAELC